MAKQRSSFFEEKRMFDPNFIRSKDCANDVKTNIRRIIKDVYFDMISDEDYVYFKNPIILSSCCMAAWENYINAQCIVNAFTYYLTNGLYHGISPFTNDLDVERTRATNTQIKYNKQAYAWNNILMLLTDIQNGADAKLKLSIIRGMAKEDILSL